MAGRVVPVPDSEGPWAKAFATLSREEQDQFEQPELRSVDILKEILSTTETTQKECVKKGWTVYKSKQGKVVKLQEVLEKSSGWVKEIVKLVDKGLTFDTSGYSALPWAGVKLLMTAGFVTVEVFAEVTQAIELISGILARCAIYEVIYINEEYEASPALLDAIIKVYATMLRYLVKAKAYFKGNTLSRGWKSLLEKLGGNFAKLKAEISEVELEKSAQLVDAEVIRGVRDGQKEGEKKTLEDFDELKESLKKLDEPLRLVSVDISAIRAAFDEQRRKEVFRWISEIEYRSHHDDISKGLVDGSGAWLLESQEFRSWNESDSSAIFLLEGSAGAGKTRLASTVIGANLQLVDSQTAFFYCVRSEAERERANPIEIIRALLRQLASCEPDLPIRQPVIDAYDTRKKKADRDGSKVQKLDVAECVKLMLELTREIPTVVIVDALDESDDPDYALISVLNQVLVRSEGLVKIFLSSRDNYNVVPLKQYRLRNPIRITITADKNGNDIKRFIDKRIKMLKRSQPLLSKSKLARDTKEALLKGAHGMFRWVDMSLETLRTPKIESDFRRKLGQLPPSLSNLYGIVYDDIDRADAGEREIAIRTLSWLLSAQRLLSVAELIAAVSVDNDGEAVAWSCDDDEHDNEDESSDVESSAVSDTESSDGEASKEPDVNLDYWSEQMLRPEWRIVRICRSFVTVDLELGAFRFAHQSVREFLKHKERYSDVEIYSLTAGRCIDAYCCKNPNNMKSTGEHNATLREYALRYIPFHCENTGGEALPTHLKEKICSFLFGAPQFDCPFGTWFDEFQIGEGPKLGFLVSKEPWTFLSYLGLLSVMVDLDSASRYPDSIWLQYAAERNDADWDAFENWHDHRLRRILAAAAYNGKQAVVQWILSRIKIEENTRNSDVSDSVNYALCNAAKNGHEEVVRTLLVKAKADPNLSPFQHPSAVLSAAQRGHLEVIKIVVKYGRPKMHIGDSDTPLHLAAFNGDEAMVAYLLSFDEVKTNVDVRNRRGETPLFRAIRSSDAKTLMRLLAAGASVNISTKTGITPLAEAAVGGHPDIMSILLSAGADPNWTEGEMQPTALYHVADTWCVWRLSQTRSSQLESTRRLLAAGADAAEAFTLAVWKERDDKLFEFFVEAGLDINAINKGGRTALHEVVQANLLSVDRIAGCLLRLGADTIAKDREGRTPLHFAADYNELSRRLVLKVLLANTTAKIDEMVDIYGDTPLSLAQKGGDEEILPLLERAVERQRQGHWAFDEDEDDSDAEDRRIITFSDSSEDEDGDEDEE